MLTDINVSLIICASALILTILCLLQSLYWKMPGLKLQKFFSGFFCVLIAYLTCNIGMNIYEYSSQTNQLNPLNYALAVLSSILVSLITGGVLYYSGEKKWYRHPLFLLVMVVFAFQLILVVSKLMFTGGLFRDGLFCDGLLRWGGCGFLCDGRFFARTHGFLLWIRSGYRNLVRGNVLQN